MDNETYGVPISKFIEVNTGKSVSTGALYTPLSRLEEKNLSNQEFGEKTSERGGRAKKMFRVEALGLKALQSSLRTRKAMWNGLEPILGI